MMVKSLTVAALLFLVTPPQGVSPEASSAPASLPAATAAPKGGRDFDTPPHGSREDQALWQATYDANNDVPLAANQASRLQYRAKTGGFEERLEVLESQGLEGRGAATELRRELEAAWSSSGAILGAHWPVDRTRVCRYPLLNLEGAMMEKEGRAKEVQLGQARAEVSDCLEKARVVLGQLDENNRRFEAVLARLDKELPPYPGSAPRPSPGEAGPAGASPAGIGK